MLRELNPFDEKKCIWVGNLGKKHNLLGKKCIGTELNNLVKKPQKM